jgi:hypothetical protein
MATPHLRRRFERILLVSSMLISAAACSDSGSAADNPDGGKGGSSGVAGGGGSSQVAGRTGSAGAVAGSSGAGSSGLGGSSGSGGQLGGATATGGTSAAAGATATGGKSTTGGATTGGATTGGATTGGATTGGKTTGGTTGSGGNTTTGGSTGSAGKTGTGGTSAGGNTSAGGTTGGGGTTATGGTTGTAGSTGTSGDYGFTYRPVQADKQLDYLCTLKAVGASTYVYVQMNQTGTKSAGMATIPVFTAVLSNISVNGTVTDLANTQYDYGSGHHNDSLQFDYQGKTYKYYHSSFSFGFRSCQPMDCVDIYAPGGTTPTTDGCTSARTLPEVCVEIKADGTHDPLKDNFKKCAGDSNP